MTLPDDLDRPPPSDDALHCQVCEQHGPLNARICRQCEHVLGRRMAELVARARFDHAFAREAFTGMDALGKQRFRVLLGDPMEVPEWNPLPLLIRGRAPGPGLTQARLRPEATSAGPVHLAKCGDEPAAVSPEISASGRVR